MSHVGSLGGWQQYNKNGVSPLPRGMRVDKCLSPGTYVAHVRCAPAYDVDTLNDTRIDSRVENVLYG